MALTHDVFKAYVAFVNEHIAPHSSVISDSERVILVAKLDERLRQLNPAASNSQRQEAQTNLIEEVRIHNVVVSGAPGPSLSTGAKAAVEGAKEAVEKAAGKVGEVLEEATDKVGSLLTVIAVIAVALAVVSVTRK